MAKYNVTQSCGCTTRHDLIGPHKSREWRIKILSEKPCDSCWREERERRNAEQNAEAAKANRELELPALIGTEKQIPWAESIRLRLLRAVDEVLQIRGDLRDHPHMPAVLDALYAETRASWWIDQRDTHPIEVVSHLLRTQPAPVDHIPIAERATVEAEATVRPERTITNTVAEIRASGSAVQILFPERRDDFRLLMHELRYHWKETAWKREIGPFNGTVADRAAEVGHQLLSAGFAVRLYDPVLRSQAIAGEFEAEVRRWVKKAVGNNPYAGWFVISWPRGEDFYKAAKRITGSRYGKGGVYVPPEQFEEVLDFAEVHGFRISDGAAELAEAARQVRENALVAYVKARKVRADPPVPGAIPPRLIVPEEVGIDAALRDDTDDIPGDHAPA